MSKDPASKDPDLKDDDAPLRRRRKGGLRVPEDNVPRPTAAPAPEEPHLAAAVALAFSDDRRASTDRGATLVEDGTPIAVAVDDLESRTTEPSAPHPDRAAAAAPVPPPEVSTIDLPLIDDDDEAVSDGSKPDSVDIPFDDDDDDERPARPVAKIAPLAEAVPTRVPRASTVALSDADLEELDDPALEVARSGARARQAREEAERIAAGQRENDRTQPIPRLDEEELLTADGAAAGAAPSGAAATTDSSPIEDDVEEVDLRTEDREPVDGEAARLRRASTEPPPPPAKQAAPAASASSPPAVSSKPKPPPAPVAARAAAVAAAADVREARKPRRRGKPWFEEIFDEDYLRTLPFLTPQATQLEAAFVMDALAIGAGSQVLDLGCGYGRHAMELAARGYHVVGLDSSLPLLLRGADEAQRRGLSINFVHGDMREINFDAQFDGAYCLFSSFGYFDDETNKKTALNMARALKPGARCVLEVLNRDYVIADLPSRVWWEGDGCVVLEEVDFNFFSSRVVSNRSVVFDDGRQLEQEISIRSFSLHELGKLLHSAGFRVVEVSGSMLTRGRFFGAHSRDIVVVAERRADKIDAPR